MEYDRAVGLHSVGCLRGHALDPLLFTIRVHGFPHCLNRLSLNMNANNATGILGRGYIKIVGHKKQFSGIQQPMQLVIDEDSIRRV